MLDPSLSRTYTARIVFAALCDKLFDIGEKANIVPQLATGQEERRMARVMAFRTAGLQARVRSILNPGSTTRSCGA